MGCLTNFISLNLIFNEIQGGCSKAVNQNMASRLKEMEEEYQDLMFESKGIQTEEIKELGRRIDDEKENIKSDTITKESIKRLKW